MPMKVIDHPKAVEDPVMTELRRNKLENAAAFDFDVTALGRSLQQREVGDPRFQMPRGEPGGGVTPMPNTESESPT
jgi:hypothetical protein